MIHRVTCDKCGSISEYDDRSIWEGNREREEVECPVWGNNTASYTRKISICNNLLY